MQKKLGIWFERK